MSREQLRTAQRVAELERVGLRYRQGVVTDDSPLTVELGGDGVALANVAQLDSAGPLAVGDVVAVLSFATELLVIGRVSAPSGLFVGQLSPSALSTAPAGWLLCDGSSKLRADYPLLYAAIGTTYGSTDGTHFNVPDLRGRVPVGLDNLGGSDAGRLDVSNTLGGSGGEQKHTLTIAELPSHTHTIPSTFNASALGDNARAAHPSNTGSDTTLTSGSAGSGNAHENMPPYLLTGWVIYAGQ